MIAHDLPTAHEHVAHASRAAREDPRVQDVVAGSGDQGRMIVIQHNDVCPRALRQQAGWLSHA